MRQIISASVLIIFEWCQLCDTFHWICFAVAVWEVWLGRDGNWIFFYREIALGLKNNPVILKNGLGLLILILIQTPRQYDIDKEDDSNRSKYISVTMRKHPDWLPEVWQVKYMKNSRWKLHWSTPTNSYHIANSLKLKYRYNFIFDTTWFIFH